MKPTKAARDARDKARGYTDADLAEVMDSPKLTAEDFAKAKPFDDVFPDLAASIKRGRGPQKAPTKVAVTLRLERDVLAHFKQGGRGWQVRIGAALRKAAGL